MRVTTVSRVVNEWVDEIAELHCITEIPKSLRSGMWHAGVGCMSRYGAKAARRAMWNRAAKWAERNSRGEWFDFVKPPPLPAFLETRR